jgi:hypothetical protein
MSTWFVRSAAAGAGTGVDWTNAVTTLAAVLSLAYAQGDTIFVADDHTESAGAGGAISFNSTESAQFTRILCADHTVASPGSGDLKIMSGSIAWTSFTNISGALYCYGLVINNTGGALTMSGARQTWKNCTLSSGAGTSLTFGSVNFCTYDNCSIILQAAGSFLSISSGIRMVMKGGSISSVGGTASISLFNNSGGYGFFDGVDMSGYTGGSTAWTGGSLQTINMTFRDCKLPSGFVPFNLTGVVAVPEVISVVLLRCDTGATNYRNEKWTHNANLLTETTVVRTGGASDGTTPISWHLATLTLAQWGQPFATFPISIWNPTAGSSVNVTVEGIADPTAFSALPNNDDFWIDVEHQGTAASVLGVITSGTKANILAAGSALTASSQAWGQPGNRARCVARLFSRRYHQGRHQHGGAYLSAPRRAIPAMMRPAPHTLEPSTAGLSTKAPRAQAGQRCSRRCGGSSRQSPSRRSKSV